MRHPVLEAGGSKSHVKAFEAVAINETLRCHPETLTWLINRGLVEKLPDRVVGKDRFGTIKVPHFAVPVWAHARWCKWASEQPDNEQT